MTGMRTTLRFVGSVVVLVVTTACGTVVREGASPVFLVMDSLAAAQGNKPGTFGGSLTSDVQTIVTSPPPCSTATPCPTIFNDIGQVKLRTSLKNIGTAANPTTPTTNNEVTITRYHVSYRRTDGLNRPGVDVPYPFDGGVTGTIPAGGSVTLSFELVRHIAKEEPPLVQLVSSRTIISTIAEVTFYGKDTVGNEISVTGSMTIDFGNFGD